MEYSQTDGGLTAKADAVSFELLKEAILCYYARLPEDQARAKITKSEDKKGKVVQVSIKVEYVITEDSYTINMYYTKCSFLVNGKSVEKFLNDDLGKIHELVRSVTLNGRPVDIAELNAKLSKELTNMLNLNRSNQSGKKRYSKQSINTDVIKCRKYGKNCLTRAAYCEASAHWVHYFCDKQIGRAHV